MAELTDAWRQRLIDRMAALGLSSADVTRRAGVNPTMVHDIIKRGVTPSVQNLAKITQVLNVTLGALFDGENVGNLTVNLVGCVAGESWTPDDVAGELPIPLNILQEDLVWMSVANDDLAPSYRLGDMLAGPRRSGNEIADLIGSDIICETIDGDRLVKVLTAGAGPLAFNLRSYDPRRPDIQNARLAWAAPIQIIVRGRK